MTNIVHLGLRKDFVSRVPDIAIPAFAFFWFFCGLSLIVAYSVDEWQATAGVLMVFQFFTGIIAFRRFRLVRGAIFPDLLTLVLIYQFGNKSLTLAGLFLGSIGDSSSFVVVDVLSRISAGVPLKYQFQAELVFLLATIVFTSIWRWQEGARILALWVEPKNNIIWNIYWVGLVLYLLIIFSGLSVFGSVSELARLFSIGAVAVFLGGRTNYSLGKGKSWITIFALIPWFVIALKSGMKAEIALVVFPILLAMVKKITMTRLIFVFGFLIFVVLFVFPFTQAWRDANWGRNSNGQQASISEVASSVTDLWRNDGFLETAQSSTAKWLSRGSTSQSGGLVMQIAERDGFIGPVLIQGLVSIFIPRFFWPDKPVYAPGAWFTWYLGQADKPETATTSTAMMLGTELYWMFGIVGVVFGMALISVINFKVWKFILNRSRKNIIYGVAMFAMMGRTGGLEEIHTIYAVSYPIIFLVYILMAVFLSKIFIFLISKRGFI